MNEQDQVALNTLDNAMSMDIYRLEISMAALCGIIQKASSFDPIRHAYLAIDYADALIDALERTAEIKAPENPIEK